MSIVASLSFVKLLITIKIENRFEIISEIVEISNDFNDFFSTLSSISEMFN